MPIPSANLGRCFDAAASPDKIAIIDLFGGRERCSTYRQLDERMNRVASMFTRLGVRPGERVAMLIGNRVEFIELFFGAMRAGAIPLLLNTRLSADTLEHLIDGAACALAVFDPSCNRDALSIASRISARHRMLRDQTKEGFLAFEEEMAKPAPPVEPASPEPAIPEVSMSATTGLPDQPANASAAGESGFSIKVTSRLVDVGLVAYDKKGHPVTDLKPEDLEVYDDGHKQESRSFGLAESSKPGVPATPTVQNTATAPTTESTITRPSTCAPCRPVIVK